MRSSARYGRSTSPWSAPGGADPAEISELSDELGIALPAELVAWLEVCRGEAIGPGGVFGVRPDRDDCDIASRLAGQPGWGRRGWPPVGDGCGNSYVLLTTGPLTGFVGFVADPGGLAYVVASDLWRFLRFLFERELGETPPELLPWSSQRTKSLTRNPKRPSTFQASTASTSI